LAHFTLLRTDLAELPSLWLQAHAGYIRSHGRVLDVAAGKGRNARWLAQQGFQVEAVDRNADSLQALQGIDGITVRVADIERDGWPYAGQQFDAIVVCRYLHRPLFVDFIDSLAADGLLIYETFMQGQEAYGKPSNPDFLLKTDELLELVRGRLEVVAFEQGLQEQPKPCMLQRIVARKSLPV
jgi:SAM-dependent methyltransferase